MPLFDFSLGSRTTKQNLHRTSLLHGGEKGGGDLDAGAYGGPGWKAGGQNRVRGGVRRPSKGQCRASALIRANSAAGRLARASHLKRLASPPPPHLPPPPTHPSLISAVPSVSKLLEAGASRSGAPVRRGRAAIGRPLRRQEKQPSASALRFAFSK